MLEDLEPGVAADLYANRIPIAIAGVVATVLLAIVAWRRGWHRAAARHPRRTAAVAALALAVAGPVGWYLGSPLFLSSTIDEPPPVIAAGPTSAPATVAPPPTPSSQGGSPVASPPATPSVPPATPAPTPTLTDRTGAFHGSDDFHFGRGTARLIETEPGVFVVRLEDFAVRNGPDLYVYLSPSAEGYARGAIELGRLKADRGNQNYAVPDGVDVTDVRSVVIWCKQFSHLFATAPLA
jgi:hypothetical protein